MKYSGYLPPTGNPPSKEPILRMLKQVRAFGVGLVLATQNPVDVDYKALSNAGTWFVGKLGTDQDKQRLLDGLTSAMGEGCRVVNMMTSFRAWATRVSGPQRTRKVASFRHAVGDELSGRANHAQPHS